DRELGALEHGHRVEQVAVVRLVDAEHLLHREAGEPDLLADDAGAGGQLALDGGELDRVGVGLGEVGVALGERRDGHARALRLEKLVGELLHGGAVESDSHACPPITILAAIWPRFACTSAAMRGWSDGDTNWRFRGLAASGERRIWARDIAR